MAEWQGWQYDISQNHGTLRIGQKLVLALVVTLMLACLTASMVIVKVADRHASTTAEEFSDTVNRQVLGAVESFANELEITSARLLGAVRLGEEVRVTVGQFRI